MAVSSGGSGVVGDSARLYPWQVDHYIVRGGPNDPVLQSNTPPTSGGSFSWNTVFTLNPVPGQQPALPRTMVPNISSSTAPASGQQTNNNGGLFMGTLPQGAWIQDIQLLCYAALSGGTSTSVGIFYTPTSTDVSYPPSTLNLLAYITSPSAGVLYGVKGSGANGITAFTQVLGSGAGVMGAAGQPTGPGLAPSSPGPTQLASLGDIDIYVGFFLAAGSGTAPTAGSFALMINFTGLEG